MSLVSVSPTGAFVNWWGGLLRRPDSYGSYFGHTTSTGTGGGRINLQLLNRINTDRLIIRPFRQDDLAGFICYMTDERVTRYLDFSEEQRTESGASELLTAVTDSYASESPLFAYAVTLKDGTFVGSCGIMDLPEGGTIECYYGLLYDHWGRGYAT